MKTTTRTEVENDNSDYKNERKIIKMTVETTTRTKNDKNNNKQSKRG